MCEIGLESTVVKVENDFVKIYLIGVLSLSKVDVKKHKQIIPTYIPKKANDLSLYIR